MARHRLKGEALARWRNNFLVIVERETGQRLRACTDKERAAYEDMLSRGSIPEVKVGGKACKLEQDREVMAREILAIYNPPPKDDELPELVNVQLIFPNGRVIKHLRPDGFTRSLFTGEVHDVPYPDVCKCKDLGKPHPGRHHPYCEYNTRARPDHRARPEDYRDLPKDQVLELSEEAPEEPQNQTVSSPSAPRVAQKPSTLPHPSECPCREWGTPNPDPGNQHNTICQHFEAWMRLHPLRKGHVLVDADTEEVLREATADEIQKASMDPSGTLIVAGRKCRVLPAELVSEEPPHRPTDPAPAPESEHASAEGGA